MNNIELGQVKVIIGEDAGEHSVEQLADMMMGKLLHISGTAPEPVRIQLEMFQQQARALCIRYLSEAQNIAIRKAFQHGHHSGGL